MPSLGSPEACLGLVAGEPPVIPARQKYLRPSAGLRQVIPENMKNEIIGWDKLLANLTRPPSAPKIRNPQR